jgi:hypothetical protein
MNMSAPPPQSPQRFAATDSTTSWIPAGSALLLGVLAIACGQAHDEPLRNLGNTGGALDPGAPASPATVEDFAGNWVGEAEDPLAPSNGTGPGLYHFPSGSTEFHLELTLQNVLSDREPPRGSAETPRLEGSLYFGADDPPAPASDFDVGYPVGVDYGSPALLAARTLPPVEGFRYSLLVQDQGGIVDLRYLNDDALTDGVLRLFLTQNEVLNDWCEAQTPVAMLDGSYNCTGSQAYGAGSENCTMLPPGVVADGKGVPEPVDCGKLYLCQASSVPICACSAKACNATSLATYGLFVRRSGEELVGSFTQTAFLDSRGELTSVGTVHFHRAK